MMVCIPGLLSRRELEQLDALLADGDFVDGTATAGRRAKRVKRNLQLDKTPEQRTAINRIVVAALERHPTFRAAVLPKRVLPPLISRYQAGMAYGTHVDDAIMSRRDPARSDVSVTVFLNHPGDYDGGELVVETGFGEQEIKLARGEAVIYPATSLHRVAPVTRGERLVAVTWAQSRVRDAAQREILFDLGKVKRLLAEHHPEARETDLAARTYSNLLRRWAEV